LRRAVIDTARVMEDWFLAHIHSGGMVSNRRENVNRQVPPFAMRISQSCNFTDFTDKKTFQLKVAKSWHGKPQPKR
jgi:hypothetical protein